MLSTTFGDFCVHIYGQKIAFFLKKHVMIHADIFPIFCEFLKISTFAMNNIGQVRSQLFRNIWSKIVTGVGLPDFIIIVTFQSCT
jgi:hypothetical protein